MTDPKKRQHHVWKHYLNAWEVEGRVSCLVEGGKPFQTDPVNLAVEKNFYKLVKLDEADEKLIRWLVIDTAQPLTKSLHEDFLKRLVMPMRVVEANRQRITNLEEVEQELDAYRCNILEDHHWIIEDKFTPLLDRIHQGDISFYEDPAQAINFCFFIAMQHMRTKGIKTRVIAELREKDGIDLGRTWDIISAMYALNMGSNLYFQRKQRKLVLIKNTTDLEFITGDQPTINLDAEAGKPVLTATTYYPVSPFLALILTETDGKSPFSTEALTTAQVAYLNARTAKASHRQIFGRSDAALLRAREDAGKCHVA
jgi:Protein of unknown function (DUF4238)